MVCEFLGISVGLMKKPFHTVCEVMAACCVGSKITVCGLRLRPSQAI